MYRKGWERSLKICLFIIKKISLASLQMMDFFELDPSRFIHLDMEQHSVARDKTTNDDELQAEEQSRKYDQYIESQVEDERQFKYLDDLSKDELKKLYIKLFHSKELVLKENMEVKAKYMSFLEKATKKDD